MVYLAPCHLKRHRLSIRILLLSAIGFAAQELPAQEAENSSSDPAASSNYEQFLTGNWNGARSHLEALGVTVGILARTDNGYNLDGGHCPGPGHILNVDFSLQLDGDDLLGWSGSSILVHALYNNGGSLNSHVGDVQMNSSLEAPRRAKVYQLWLQQAFAGGRLSALLGLYDLNTEFYLTPASSLFLNGSFGVGKEFSQTGKSGPSIFPNTAFALRIKGSIKQNGYLQLAGIDATPGHAYDPGAAAVSMNSEDGLLLVGEGGFEGRAGAIPLKAAAGAWVYASAPEEHVPMPDATPYSGSNWGAYLLSELQLAETPEPSIPAVSLFARAGFARGIVNEFDYDLAAGIVCSGLFNDDPTHRMGLAFSAAHRSFPFRSAQVESKLNLSAAETVIELTYQFRPASWIAVQADCQYVMHPASEAGLSNATVVIGRFEVAL